MKETYFSDIELYYSPATTTEANTHTISGQEADHIIKVMRHKVGDEIYITNGKGKIFFVGIESLSKKEVEFRIKQEFDYKNIFSNFIFCLPRLRNADRFEFALEKCIELGITNFIVYDAERSTAKGPKLERWRKIGISAMKQSLRSYLPFIDYQRTLTIKGNSSQIILFEQKSDITFPDFINDHIPQLTDKNKNFYFVFGPEGGLSEIELENFKDANKVKLTNNRLRTETAIVSAASLISVDLQSRNGP